MKCIVLAGGNGGSLWPISRKEFPQQFVEIRDGRSVFQENIDHFGRNVHVPGEG